MLDDGLTLPDGWNGAKTVAPDELEEVEAEELEVPALGAEVPGIVDALTTASTPTPAIAPIATPVVRRLSVCIASSRAITLALVAWVSMIGILGGGSEPCLRASWELAESLMVPPEGIEPPTLTLGPSCSIP